VLGPLCFHEDLVVHEVQTADGALHHGLQAHDIREVDLAVLSPDGGDIFTDLFPAPVGNLIYGGKAHGSALLQRGEGFRQGVISLIIALQRPSQLPGGGDLSHILQLVTDLVELLGMMPVVLQHIFHEGFGLFDALEAAAMLVRMRVRMGMIVAVVMGVGMLMGVV